MFLIAALGCSRQPPVAPVPRVTAPPDLQVSVFRLAGPGAGYAAWRLRWVATTHGAALSHFLWALDPASVDSIDSSWVRTTESSHDFTLRTNVPHVIAVRAVDASGAMSSVWSRVFPVVANLPPSVSILRPEPRPDLRAVVSNVLIEWLGTDDDSPGERPARYLYRLFGAHNPDVPGIDFPSFALAKPESLSLLYTPPFAGWTEVPPESTAARVALGAVGSRWVFLITCVDVDGGFDPSFAVGRNILGLEVFATGGERVWP